MEKIETLRWDSLGHGRSDPAVVRHVEQSPIGAHMHDFIEIVYVVDGFCLHLLNEESTLLLSGDLMVIRPGESHRYRGRRNVSIINFLFRPESFGAELEEVKSLAGMRSLFSPETAEPGWRTYHHLSLAERERVTAICNEISIETESQLPGWDIKCRALLIEFMVLLSRVFSARFALTQSGGAYSLSVMRAIELIDENYASDISVADIARQVGVCADHMTRQFVKTLGITPSELIRRRRFTRAIELLRAGDSVTDACVSCGFHHLSHFSREFKETFGMNPSDYVRQYRM